MSEFRSTKSVGGFLWVLRFPPPVKLTFHYHHHCPDMTLADAETSSPNKPNLDMTLTVAEAINPNTPNNQNQFGPG